MDGRKSEGVDIHILDVCEKNEGTFKKEYALTSTALMEKEVVS